MNKFYKDDWHNFVRGGGLACLLLILFCSSMTGQVTYYSTAVRDDFSATSGGASCACRPGPDDFIVIEHDWITVAGEPDFTDFPAERLGLLTSGGLMPARITVRSGGQVIATGNPRQDGTDLIIESGGWFGFDGAFTTDPTPFFEFSGFSNEGTLAVNGSFANNLAGGGGGKFCVSVGSSWVNNPGGSVNGITDADMTTHFGSTQLGCASDCCAPAGTLPVELIDFYLNEGVNSTVQWVTGAELNTSHFTLEKSLGDGHWSDVGTMQAAGFSSEVRKYSLPADQEISSDAVYYRLKMVDLDGSYRYSRIISSDEGEDGDLDVFQQKRSIQFDYLGRITAVRVFDLSGNLIDITTTSSLFSSENKSTCIVSTQSFSSGIYLFIVEREGNVAFHKKMFIR